MTIIFFISWLNVNLFVQFVIQYFSKTLIENCQSKTRFLVFYHTFPNILLKYMRKCQFGWVLYVILKVFCGRNGNHNH